MTTDALLIACAERKERLEAQEDAARFRKAQAEFEMRRIDYGVAIAQRIIVITTCLVSLVCGLAWLVRH